MKTRFADEQAIGFLREADAGMAVTQLCRKHGFSGARYYLWRSKFGGMEVSEAKRLKALEALQIRRRRRNKVSVTERHPLLRPSCANALWWMDFGELGSDLEVFPRIFEIVS